MGPHPTPGLQKQGTNSALPQQQQMPFSCGFDLGSNLGHSPEPHLKILHTKQIQSQQFRLTNFRIKIQKQFSWKNRLLLIPPNSPGPPPDSNDQNRPASMYASSFFKKISAIHN
jgi:hypothetical protein